MLCIPTLGWCWDQSAPKAPSCPKAQWGSARPNRPTARRSLAGQMQKSAELRSARVVEVALGTQLIRVHLDNAFNPTTSAAKTKGSHAAKLGSNTLGRPGTKMGHLKPTILHGCDKWSSPRTEGLPSHVGNSLPQANSPRAAASPPPLLLDLQSPLPQEAEG